jgi:vacuolar-type H+-ATPase subunit D/Vma8
METVDKVLAEKRDKLRAEFKAELEREVQALRNEFLQDRLDAARSTLKLSAVQSAPVSLIA